MQNTGSADHMTARKRVGEQITMTGRLVTRATRPQNGRYSRTRSLRVG